MGEHNIKAKSNLLKILLVSKNLKNIKEKAGYYIRVHAWIHGGVILQIIKKEKTVN
jgi:hypothetical protein